MLKEFCCFIFIVSNVYSVDVEVGADGTISEPVIWSCLHEQSLVTNEIGNNHKSIIDNHNKTCENKDRNFDSDSISLTFITPWHRKGYKWTERFSHKFSHISPTWFKISKFPSSQRILILGDNDVDKHWMQKIRSLGNGKIVPRFHFENDWTQEQMTALLSKKDKQTNLLNEIISTMKRNDLDGAVLEMTPFFSQIIQLYSKIYQQNKDASSQYDLDIDPQDLQLLKKLKKRLNNFIIRIGKRFRKTRKELFIVLSPYFITFLKTLKLDAVAKYATGLPVMSYDYAMANIRDAGPNAPLQWLEQIIQTFHSSVPSKYHSKLLLGLNWYGYKYEPQFEGPPQPQSFLNSDLLQALENDGENYQWVWDETTQEHRLEHSQTSAQIYYPSLYSIAKRLELAKEYGTGISIWELGQGLEYFCELL